MRPFAFERIAGTLLAGLLLAPCVVQAQGESAECRARRLGLEASAPPVARPQETRAQIEVRLQASRQLANGMTVEAATAEYERVKKKIEPLRAAKYRELTRLDGEDRKVEEDLATARNQLAKERIAQLEARREEIRAERKRIELENLDLAIKGHASGARVSAAEQAVELMQELAALDTWPAYDKAIADYRAVEAAKDAELTAVQTAFDAERARFNQQKDVLLKAGRDDATFQTARDLKDRTRATFEQLKSRLLKHQCWPLVANFIQNELEPRIFRLQRQKTVLPSDVEGDDAAAGPLDLPPLDGGEAAVESPGPPPPPPSAAPIERIAGTWAGTFKRNDTGATGPVGTVFTLENGKLGGWHYQESWVMEGVTVAGNTVTFSHVYGQDCRAQHSFTILNYEARQAQSKYTVTCPGPGGHTGTIIYGK